MIRCRCYKDPSGCHVKNTPQASRWTLGDQPGSHHHGQAEAAGGLLGRDWESEIRGVELGSMGGSGHALG